MVLTVAPPSVSSRLSNPAAACICVGLPPGVHTGSRGERDQVGEEPGHLEWCSVPFQNQLLFPCELNIRSMLRTLQSTYTASFSSHPPHGPLKDEEFHHPLFTDEYSTQKVK